MQAGSTSSICAIRTGWPRRRWIDLGEDATYYYSPKWSPDSKRILFSDKRLNLWYVNVDSGKPVKVDADLREGFGPSGFSAELFAGQQLDSVCALTAEPGECGVPVLDGERQKHADYRWHEQRHEPGVRRQREVHLLYGEHRYRSGDRWVLELGSLKSNDDGERVYQQCCRRTRKSPIPPESDDEKDKADADKKPAPADGCEDRREEGRSEGVRTRRRTRIKRRPTNQPR